MLIKLEKVSSLYGNVLALRDISLQVAEGELVTLIGANGAGKSTTLKVITSIVKPKAGRVTFNGEDISKCSTREVMKRGVVHVPEGRQVFPLMTVHENLEMGAFLMKDKRVVQERLDVVFLHFPILKERLSQQAGTLSGGQQQMLAIGRGLMLQPKLLLLDEPSLGLSPLLVKEVLRIIKVLHETKITFLLVEQNAKAALEISDRGYVLETGKTVLAGKAEDLLKNDNVRRAYLGF
jgi:branched-chain amino acid transport system ATP-binding protein